MTMQQVALILTTLLAGACAAWGAARESVQESVVAVVDVTVVPMDIERALPHHTVLIREGAIISVSPAASAIIPSTARRIDGTGRYLIPGLTDAHVHLRDMSELLSYLAYGVTTVAHLSGPVGNVPNVPDLRDRIARGDVLGPRVLTSGLIIDGEPPIFAGVSTVVETPEQARQVVEAQIDAGVDFIKVYNNLRTGSLREVVTAAHRKGVPVWGHIPRIDGRDTALQAALTAGMDVIAHGEELFFTILYRDIEQQLDQGVVPSVDAASIAESVRLVRQAGAAVIPNLSFVVMTRAQLDDINGVRADRDARFLTQAVSDMWEQQNPTRRRDLPRFDLRERGKASVLKTLTRALNEAGVPLLLGTDAAAPGMYPGKSAHTELQALVDAGLTPYEALATGTRNAGSIIGKHVRSVAPFGTVAAGSRADLVLLEGNPLTDIRNVAAISGVFVNGAWFARATLDCLRAQQVGSRTR